MSPPFSTFKKNSDFYLDLYNATMKSRGRTSSNSSSSPVQVSPNAPLNLSFTFLHDPPSMISSNVTKPIDSPPRQVPSKYGMTPQRESKDRAIRRKLDHNDELVSKAARRSFHNHRSVSDNCLHRNRAPPHPSLKLSPSSHQWMIPHTFSQRHLKNEKSCDVTSALTNNHSINDSLYNSYVTNTALLPSQSFIPLRNHFPKQESAGKEHIAPHLWKQLNPRRENILNSGRGPEKTSFNSGSNQVLDSKKSSYFSQYFPSYPGLSLESLDALQKSYPYLLYPIPKQIPPPNQTFFPYQNMFSSPLTSPNHLSFSHYFGKPSLYETSPGFINPNPAPMLHSRSASSSSIESQSEGKSDSGFESHDGDDKLEVVSWLLFA